MTKRLFIGIAICAMIICAAIAPLCHAQGEGRENVDEIIEGFEEKDASDTDKAASDTGDDLQDVMQGFEDDSPPKPEEPVENDDFLKGFDDETTQGTDPPPSEDMPSSWRLEGELAFTATYNFSPDATAPWSGVTMVRPELELILKNKFSDRWQGQISARGFYDAVYELRGRDEYTGQVLDENEAELELKDTFIQGSITSQLDTKIGRQVVVWGTLDNLRVTDVLNPLDLRLPGVTDIDDLRLPVTMLKFDYYLSNWNLSGMVIPEVRFSKRPAFGSDFFPFPRPRPTEDEPDDGFEDAQYAAALTGVFSGWDIGLYGAYIYADQSYAEAVSVDSQKHFVQKHARIGMAGAAANLALGNWLLKTEAAGIDGLQFTNTPDLEYTRLDIGGGVEYSGFNETTVSLEAVNRHLFDYSPLLGSTPDDLDENEFQWAFRITRDFLNDTLTLTLFSSTFGIKADDGSFIRLDGEYDINDAVSVRGGVVLYQSGDKGIFQNVDDNDRLFVVLTYNF